MKILLLCTGNTCRSPMAEALMKKKCEEKNLNISCCSCGISAFSGDSAAENAVKVMKERSLDISHHRSRKLNEYMIDEYDLFVVMTATHKQMLSSIMPEEKILVLGDSIPDPYGGDEEVYRICADKISESLDALLDELCTVKIMPMDENDVGDIAQIEKECFSQPWSEEGIKSELQNESARFFTAKRLKETLGYVGMHVVLDECYIANIAVKPLFRRQGVANELLNKAEDTAKKEGCAFISLEVRVSNEAAKALYEKRGYDAVGERKNFYSEPTENALIMTKTF